MGLELIDSTLIQNILCHIAKIPNNSSQYDQVFIDIVENNFHKLHFLSSISKEDNFLSFKAVISSYG